MNAIYARQSIDKADSISIESQIEFCTYELRGADYKVYADRGYSGKNTDRPAFGALMRDIEMGIIQKVVVYKLDRISRSILDFSNMMERFERHRVEFVSTTEKFDTSSPMGRAMLNICIVFAQLERETIQKRVADAYFSRSQKRFYMGGRVPYGFRLVPTNIDGVQTAMYEAESAEAEQVRLMYALYAEPTCSYGDIVRTFKNHGMLMLRSGKPWGRTRLAELLKNPVYVRADPDVYDYYRTQGVTIVNPPEDFIGMNGCYLHREKNYMVLAPHEGLVPAELWLKCQAKSAEKARLRPCQKAKNTWLAGKLKCGMCGYALVDKHYPNGRYLLCTHKMNARACPGAGTLYTDEIESIIAEELRQKLSTFPVLRKQTTPPDPELKCRLLQISNEITTCMEQLSTADGALFRYINERVQILDSQKQQLESQLAAHRQYGREIHSHLTVWDELSFDDKRQVVDLLIRVIHVTQGKIQIDWRI